MPDYNLMDLIIYANSHPLKKKILREVYFPYFETALQKLLRDVILQCVAVRGVFHAILTITTVIVVT